MVEPEETDLDGHQLDKHLSAATDTHATSEKVLEIASDSQ
jgi:hypothetical protein